jgi:hypothetical protein
MAIHSFSAMRLPHTAPCDRICVKREEKADRPGGGIQRLSNRILVFGITECHNERRSGKTIEIPRRMQNSMAVKSSHSDLQDPQVRSIAGLVPPFTHLSMRANRSFPFYILTILKVVGEHSFENQLARDTSESITISDCLIGDSMASTLVSRSDSLSIQP